MLQDIMFKSDPHDKIYPQNIDLPPEIAILLYCARTEMSRDRQTQLGTLLASRVDWERLIRYGTEHGILPLLYWHINALPPETVSERVPAATLAELREHFQRNSMKNFRLCATLLQILSGFDVSGVRLLPLKGVALAAPIYGDVALRQPGDLDLLVSPEDAAKAIDLLTELGYQPVFQEEMSPARKGAYLRVHPELTLQKLDPPMHLDLHWRLFPRWFGAKLDFDALWERRQMVDIRGTAVPIMNPTDSLVYLCLHGSKHRWQCLKWVCDVAELLREVPELDWNAAQIRAGGRAGMLRLGVALAHNLLDAPLPKAILAQITDDAKTGGFVAKAWDWLFNRDQAPGRIGRLLEAFIGTSAVTSTGIPQPFADESRNIRVCLSLRLCGWRVVRSWAAYLLSPSLTDIRWVSLPPSLFFLYYPLRLIRLAGRAGVGAWRWVVHRWA